MKLRRLEKMKWVSRYQWLARDFLFLVIFVCFVGCSSAPLSRLTKFSFSDSLPEKTKHSLEDYRSGRKLQNGFIYGSFVRTVHLRGESASSLKKKLLSAPCSYKEDVIREPVRNSPISDSSGKTAPLWIWTCLDGGVIRAKPLGDPTSRFRPEPQASKSLRYPPDVELKSFADETVKLDEEGNEQPKWPTDMKEKSTKILDEWADQVHIALEKS